MTDAERTAFFSYSREDSEWVLRLAEDLKKAGANVWLDQRDIAPGQRWAVAVQEALTTSPCVLVVLSPAAVNSPNVQDEVTFALEEKKNVIPVFYRDCRVPLQLRSLQYADFRTDYDRGLQALLRSLGVSREAAVGVAVSAAPSAANPAPASAAQATETLANEPARRRWLTREELRQLRRAPAPAGSEKDVALQDEGSRARFLSPSRLWSLLRQINRRAEDSRRRERAWLIRNWKWLLPTAVVAFVSLWAVVMLILGTSTVGQTAVNLARSNPSVAERLGEPVKRSLFTWGSLDTSHAELEIPLSGPKGAGTINATANKSAGKWVFEALSFTSDGDNRRVDLMNMLSIWALGATTSGAGNVGSVILHSDDGGQSWEVQRSGTENIHAVAFASPKLGWAVGRFGIILHTEDGGQTWTGQSSPTKSALWSVTFTSETEGWAVGEDAVILHTADAGHTWLPQDLTLSHLSVASYVAFKALNSVAFAESRSGWAVGEPSLLVNTLDGGQSWKQRSMLEDQTRVARADLPGRLYSVQFVTPQSGWIAGEGGAILHTGDGGLNWEPQHLGGSTLRSISFPTAHLGWAVGENGTMLHTQDGRQWKAQDSGTDRYLGAVLFSTSQLGWAVGGNGTVLRTEDGGRNWKPQASGTNADLVSLAQAPTRQK